MKATALVGVLLIIFGIVGLAYQGFSYTKRKDVADIGPIHATNDTRETIPVSPVLGGLALVGGIALLVMGGKSGA